MGDAKLMAAAFVGTCVGFVARGALDDVSRWFEARKAKRESVAAAVAAENARARLQRLSDEMERSMAESMDAALELARKLATEATPGCACAPCAAKRKLAERTWN